MNNLNYEIQFNNKLREHLRHYYIETLGLSDFESRVAYRANEEKIEEERLKNLIQKIGWNDEIKKIKMLVVGSGWGGMLYAANKLGIDVCGIDIDRDEIEISKLRFLKDGITPAPIYLAPAENLPFEDNTFDLVYCFSVIEHVQDVEKSISEITRVMKPNAYAYIQTQNFNIPWEPHYKLVLPTFIGKFPCKVLLRLRGRNPAYLDTINFIRRGSFLKLLISNRLFVVEEWDICKETKLPSQAIDRIRKSSPSDKNLIRYLSRFDEYMGWYVLKIFPLLGIKNIDLICRKEMRI